MSVVAGNPLIAAAGPPERTRFDFGRCNSANSECEQESKSKDGFLTIGFLTTAFVGKCCESARLMNQFDSRFHLVAMLSAGTAGAGATFDALFEELMNGNGSGVKHG